MRTAVEIAAQVWCDPRCSNIEMDSRLAEVFAEEIEKLLKVVEAAKAVIQKTYCDATFSSECNACQLIGAIGALEE